MKITVQGLDSIVLQIGQQPTAIQRAAVRALNRGIKSGRTVMTRSIAQDTGLKSATVRDALRMKQASIGDQSASLEASLRRIPLIDFNAKGPEPSRGKGHGITYKLGAEGGGRIENAFITTMGSGHRGVFARVGRTRLPIRELFGPSLGRVFLKYRESAQARVIEMFQRNFGHELELETNGFWKATASSPGTPDDVDVAA
jgi:hypothetical protein